MKMESRVKIMPQAEADTVVKTFMVDKVRVKDVPSDWKAIMMSAIFGCSKLVRDEFRETYEPLCNADKKEEWKKKINEIQSTANVARAEILNYWIIRFIHWPEFKTVIVAKEVDVSERKSLSWYTDEYIVYSYEKDVYDRVINNFQDIRQKF